MAVHSGRIMDDGSKFQIVPSTRQIAVPQSHKILGTVGSHRSEQVTFQCPKEIDRHPVDGCSKHFVVWRNAEGGIGKCDLNVTETDDQYMYMTWVLYKDATAVPGVLSFSVHFEDYDGDGNLWYAWSTGECTGCEILGAVVDNTGDATALPVPEGYIKPRLCGNITENGLHDVTTWESANVDVYQPELRPEIFVENGTYKAPEGCAYDQVQVLVQPALQEKVVSENGEVAADSGFYGLGKVTVDVQPNLEEMTVTGNGVVVPTEGHDGLSKVTVNVQPALQEKTATESGVIVPDAGFDGLSKVTVNITQQFVHIVQSIDKLPANATEGTLAIVLGEYE